MVARIKSTQFYGASKVFTGEADGMTAVIRGMAQTQARLALAANTTALTDDSGGTASTTLPAVPAFVAVTVSGTDAISKVSIDAAFAAVNQAYTDLIAQAIALNTIAPVKTAITNSLTGTPSATIAAIPVTFTGVATGTADYATASALLGQYVTTGLQVVDLVNSLAAATGSTPLVATGLNAVANYTSTFAALPVATGASQDATALDQITVTNAEAVFVAFADLIASAAAVLNNMRVTTGPLNVVAV